MNPLDLVKLTPLMELSKGSHETVIGLMDGPVAMEHPDLASELLHQSSEQTHISCAQVDSAACRHGTFTAGILIARRESPAPAICPGCTLLVRPIFKETSPGTGTIPSATPGELAAAIVECVDAGARVLNLSVAFAQPSSKEEHELEEALNHAATRGAIVVAAAGNQGTLGSSAITRHRWVIPVAACDLQGKPVNQSNLGSSIGRQGLRAPGAGIISLGTKGEPLTLGGTSVAAPFVTGAVALLWSIFPAASPTEVKTAITGTYGRRIAVLPPLLDAWAGYLAIARYQRGKAAKNA